MPIRVRDVEASVATDDASSNAAGFIKKYTSPNDFIQKLNGAGPKIGTNMVLKVMAGDKLSLNADNYYESSETSSSNVSGSSFEQVVNSLAQAAGQLSGTEGTIASDWAAQMLKTPNNSPFHLMARLKPGVTVERAQAELWNRFPNFDMVARGSSPQVAAWWMDIPENCASVRAATDTRRFGRSTRTRSCC